MKRIIYLLSILLIIIVIGSCDPKIIEHNKKAINNHQLISFGINYMDNLNPANLNNVIDSCGYYHNLILFNFISEHNFFESDTILFWRYLDTLFQHLGNSNFMNSNQTVNSVIFHHFVDSINGLSHDWILNNFSYSDYCRTKLNSLFGILHSHTDTTNTTIDTIVNIINEIKQWEGNVISELNFHTFDTNNHQAIQLLSASSIMRYSLCFWITAINDTNSPLRMYIPTNSVNPQAKNKQNRITLTTIEVFGIGAVLYLVGSDVDGCIAGSQRPKLDENGVELKNPDGTPVMETLRGTEGAALGSARAAKRIGGWLMDLTEWIFGS